MTQAFSILIIAILVAGIEVPLLKRNKWNKEMWVFFIFLIAGTGLAAAATLKLTLPNPLDWISRIYAPVIAVMNHIVKPTGS